MDPLRFHGYYGSAGGCLCSRDKPDGIAFGQGGPYFFSLQFFDPGPLSYDGGFVDSQQHVSQCQSLDSSVPPVKVAVGVFLGDSQMPGVSEGFIHRSAVLHSGQDQIRGAVENSSERQDSRAWQAELREIEDRASVHNSALEPEHNAMGGCETLELGIPVS